MTVRIVLVRPDTGRAPFADVPPLGLGYLASALRRNHHPVSIVDFAQPRLKTSRGLALVKEFQPDVVGIQAVSRTVTRARRLVEALRAILPAKTLFIVGGPHPSSLPSHIFEHIPGIDYGIAGEGELSLQKVLNGIEQGTHEIHAIAGLVYKQDGEVICNPPVFHKDIDVFDVPAWDLLTPRAYSAMMGGFAKRQPVTIMLTSRGCPFYCAFCSAKFLGGGLYRCRSPEAIREEMSFLRKTYGIREIKFVDDNFNGSREHVFRVSEVLRKKPVDVSVSMACGLNLKHLDDEVLEALKVIGVYEIPIAIESGSQDVLKKMNKPIQLKRIHEDIARIRRHGFPVIAYFLLGFPGETKEDLRKSISLALSLPLRRVHVNCFSPLPGSPIYQQLSEQGRLPPLENLTLHFETFEHSFVEGLSVRDLNRIRKTTLLKFYLRPSVLPGFLLSLRRPATIRFIYQKALEYFSA